jgi:hypothetical protein
MRRERSPSCCPWHTPRGFPPFVHIEESRIAHRPTYLARRAENFRFAPSNLRKIRASKTATICVKLTSLATSPIPTRSLARTKLTPPFERSSCSFLAAAQIREHSQIVALRWPRRLSAKTGRHRAACLAQWSATVAANPNMPRNEDQQRGDKAGFRRQIYRHVHGQNLDAAIGSGTVPIGARSHRLSFIKAANSSSQQWSRSPRRKHDWPT